MAALSPGFADMGRQLKQLWQPAFKRTLAALSKTDKENAAILSGEETAMAA
jgi:hypothetical protein